MTFITSACISVNFNSKDIRIQSARLKSKYRKLVTLENLQKSVSEVATKLEITSDNIYRKIMNDICECTTNLVTLSGECVPIWSFRFTLPLIAKECFIEFLNLRFTKTQYIG